MRLRNTSIANKSKELVFDLGHSYRCKTESQSCLDLYFSDD